MSKVAHAFVAGLSARHDAAASQLRHEVAGRSAGFAPADLIARLEDAFSTESGPKSYAPADRAANPTEGWDPLDPTSSESAFIDPVEEARR
jgi:flagellar assembly protein FliH